MKKSLIYSGLLFSLFAASFELAAEDLRPIGDLALEFVKQKAFQGILHAKERNKYSTFTTVNQFNRENEIVQSAAKDVQLASAFMKDAVENLKHFNDSQSKIELKYLEPIIEEIEKYKEILNDHISSKKIGKQN